MKICAEELGANLNTRLALLSARRKARLITPTNLKTLIQGLEKHLHLLDEGYDEIESLVCGGGVPNSYKWRAQTDKARVIVSKRFGKVYVEIERVPAPKFSRGQGPYLVVLARLDGEGKSTTLETKDL